MDHVLGLVQTDTWEPFERGIGDVVGIPDPNHRGIGIESRENGVCDLHKVLLIYGTLGHRPRELQAIR